MEVFTNMETDKIFNDIVNELELGFITIPVEKVTGGFMHKMYSLVTNKGKYAIKLLNPVIMTRPDVFKNYEIAEYLENKLQNNDIPIIPALTFGGKKMQCINNQYYYIFNWIDGRALDSQEIEQKHCEIIGAVLAKIHKIEQTDKATIRNEINIDWDSYIVSSKDKCPEITDILKDNKKILYKSQNEGNAALKNIPDITVISNGDMDSKNVLWIDGKPKIIDLECLNYGNPYMELFQLALCWSGYEHCRINYTLLAAFIKSYINVYGNFKINWKDLYSSNFGRLEWLEYNIKRALMIECENEEERQLGVGQVKETMEHIIYYDLVKDELLRELDKIAYTTL